VNLKLVELAQQCEDLTVDEAKALIHHLKLLVDAEELASRPATGWRKRIVSQHIMNEEHLND
jgi:hypothetical protein